MAKRVLQIEWRSRPTADGRERLARAVTWMIEHAPSRRLRADDGAQSKELVGKMQLEESSR